MSRRFSNDVTTSFFRSTRVTTITAIVVAILALAGVGVLAGALVDQQAPELVGEELSSGGVGPPAPQVDADPTPITGETTAPTVAPTEAATAAPTTAPTPEVTPGGTDTTGTSVVLGGGAVTIPLPAPWKQDWIADDGLAAGVSNGQGDFAYVEYLPNWYADVPDMTASVALSTVYQQILNPQFYTQLQVGTVAAREPFGAMRSLAVLPYQAMWVDSQSTFPLFGNAWAGIDQTGSALFMTVEGTPPERFDQEAWRPILEGAFQSFAQP